MQQLRAALYLRQSERDDQGIDDRQRPRTTALCEAKGWTVAAEFVDNDVTASKPRGPQTAWGRMLAALERREFEVVVAVDMDRLLRGIPDLATLIELGAKVVTVDGEIDLSTADGEFRATMLAGIARFEGRRKSERMIRGNAARALKGESNARVRRFGYNLDGTVLDVEADALRDGYDALLDGKGLAQIGRTWDEAGLTSTQGGSFGPRPSVVRRILENPANVGWSTLNGEVVARTATWPAIVEEQTYLAVVAKLNDPSRRVKPRSGRRLLTGIARCSVDGCGATVHATGAKASTGHYAVYRCSKANNHRIRKAQPVDDWIERLVVERLSRPDARDLLVRKGPDVEALQAEVARMRGRLDALTRAFADDKIDEDALIAGSERLHERMRALDADLADAGKADVLGPLVGKDDVRAAWDAMDVDRRRVVIEALMKSITLLPVGRGNRRSDDRTMKATVQVVWR